MTVFAVMMSGLFDFMANQTLNLAYIKDRETMLYYAKKWLASNDVGITEADGVITFSSADDALTVTLNGKTSLTFSTK